MLPKEATKPTHNNATNNNKKIDNMHKFNSSIRIFQKKETLKT